MEALHNLRKISPPPCEVVPTVGRFVAQSFSNEAGSRGYKLYVPSCHNDVPRPLIVMLHGCTQSPDDFAAGTRMNFVAEEQSCFVVYPEQAVAANASKCWNWFKRSDQKRGEGEPAIIAGITRQVMAQYKIDLHGIRLLSYVVCLRKHFIRSADDLGIGLISALAHDHIDHFFNDAYIGLFHVP